MAPKPQKGPRTSSHPFLLPVNEVAKQLDSNIETGLTARRVAELQRECLPNELADGGGIAWYKILTKQLSNAMILVSLSATLPYFLLNLTRFSYLQWL